ncbi:MAG: nucleotidyltransferase domain-containing protein [Gaiellaceae bacterium]
MSEAESAIVRAVHRRVAGATVILAGSRATGGAAEGSDYDVVVGVPWARLPLTLRPLARASDELSRELGVPVSVNPVPEARLRRPPRNLFLWKLHAEGRVLAGTPLGPAPPFIATQSARRSYALSAAIFVLADPESARARAKAARHLAQLRLLERGEYDSAPAAGATAALADEIAAAAAGPGLGPALLVNARYAVLSAARGRARFRALGLRGSVEAALADSALELLHGDAAAARTALPRFLRPGGDDWGSVRDVVVAEWPAAHPVLAL